MIKFHEVPLLADQNILKTCFYVEMQGQDTLWYDIWYAMDFSAHPDEGLSCRPWCYVVGSMQLTSDIGHFFGD